MQTGVGRRAEREEVHNDGGEPEAQKSHPTHDRAGKTKNLAGEDRGATSVTKTKENKDQRMFYSGKSWWGCAKPPLVPSYLANMMSICSNLHYGCSFFRDRANLPSKQWDVYHVFIFTYRQPPCRLQRPQCKYLRSINKSGYTQAKLRFFPFFWEQKLLHAAFFRQMRILKLLGQSCMCDEGQSPTLLPPYVKWFDGERAEGERLTPL